MTFTVDVPVDGDYALVLSGANGHGPDGTYCTIRSVFIDNVDAGTFILEATGDWNKWMRSNYLWKNMKAGRHTVSLRLNRRARVLTLICLMVGKMLTIVIWIIWK